MKKPSVLLFSALTCSCLSVANAGDMGPASSSSSHPYVAAEASYTWRQIDDPNINGIAPSLSTQPWGFRISGGLLRFYTDRLGLSAELGGGYYGKLSGSAPLLSTTANMKIDGYDVLLGGLYRLNHVDIFAQAGFMMQNNRYSYVKGNLAENLPGTSISGSESNHLILAETLPEIRVGAIYNVLDNVGVTFAYTHVFGATMMRDVNIVPTSTGINSVTTQNAENPTLDSIFLGLRYYIA